MPHTYIQLFEILPNEEPPQELFDRVCERVGQAEVSRLRARSGMYSGIAAVAAAGGITALVYLVGSIARSEIPQYVSLIFSDGSSVMASWKELVLSVSDSFPVAETAGTLAVALACMYSLRTVSRCRMSLSEKAGRPEAHYHSSLPAVSA